MRAGRLVETADVAQLKQGRLANPYSRELAALSGGDRLCAPEGSPA
jgi:hypothetical protein